MINVKELSEQVSATGRRAGGRQARISQRSAPVAAFSTLTRKIPVYELVPDEAIELIHAESVKILEDVGIEFRDEEATTMWRQAGADVRGQRVRIDRAQLMELVSRIPPEFTLNARNPARTAMAVGWYGGRAVVSPVTTGLPPANRVWTCAARRWHIFPWQGPIVTVL